MAARTEEAKLVRFGDIGILVDGFLFQRADMSLHVLTHFHGDHTVGLTRSFSAGTIFCTDVTAALVTELMGVDPKCVRGLKLGETLELPGSGGVRLTLLDADHCPGSAVAVFEAPDRGRVVLHTGDCRASARMREGLREWLNGRQVDELFLDTTYCNKRWTFPAQDVACKWLQEIVRAELAREPKTLFVVGSYQIGKERAVRSVAEVVDSPAYLEHRRWRVIQLADWGDERLPSGRPLWSIDKEGCQVWMTTLGGLGHDALEGILNSVKGYFNAVVAFRPTGWAWTPKRMSEQGSAGCRVWAENEGKTRIYGVPYSEHSSYTELRALGEMLMPKKLVPTVNSETQASKERVMSQLIGTFDLKADPERMDHYLFGHDSSAGSSCEGIAKMVDVLALSAADPHVAHEAPKTPARLCPSSSTVTPEPRARAAPCRWGRGVLRSTPRTVVELDISGTLSDEEVCIKAAATLHHPAEPSKEPAAAIVEVVDSDVEAPQRSRSHPSAASSGSTACSSDAAACCARGASSSAAGDELRCVDMAQQERLLRYYEAISARSRATIAALSARRKPFSSKQKQKLGRRLDPSSTPGAAKNAKLLPQLLGAKVCSDNGGKTLQRRKKGGGVGAAKRTKRSQGEADSGGLARKRAGDGAEGRPARMSDPKPQGERRPTRFVPRPSERVRERIARAFGHKLYFLASKVVEEGRGVQFDVLGSTGNVYNVKLTPAGNECSCLDFAKASGACKHLLFVMLRILKLPQDDYRVWQTSFVPSELKGLLELLSKEPLGQGVQADSAVIRGYQEAAGQVPKSEPRPLPADCPICFDEMQAPPDSDESGHCSAGLVAFCRVCGHAVHTDCQQRWAAVSVGGNVCPMCRSPWVTAQTTNGGPVNLAAYSAEHRAVSLAELYPETHQWIGRRRESQVP